MEQAELASVLQAVMQQQTALVQAHLESLRLQNMLLARLVGVPVPVPAAAPVTLASSEPAELSETVAPVNTAAPRSVDPEDAAGDRPTAHASHQPKLHIVGGTATRATRYFQEQPRSLVRPVSRQDIDVLKRVQDTGPAGQVVLQFGQYKGQALGAIAQADPDYVRWLSLKAQRPQVREAARRVLAALSPPGGRSARGASQ